MARQGTVNTPQAIWTQLYDGAEDKFVRAYIYNCNKNLVTTVNLCHVALGGYMECWTPIIEGQYSITIIVYDDMAFTIENECYQREGDVLDINNVAGSISTIPGDVWDELTASHVIPNTFGSYISVIRQTVLDNNYELISNPSHSLPMIKMCIINNTADIISEINENEVKIDSISSQNSAEFLSLQGDILTNRSDIGAVNTNINTKHTVVVGEINENEIKIDANLNAIQQIQNNTRFVAVVPQVMRRPDVGTITYQFFLAIYDTIGNPEAPDSTPTINIKDSAGGIFLAETSMTQDGLKIGQYFYNISVASGSSEPILRIEFKIIENSVTRYCSRVSQIVEFDTTLAQIENKIDIIDSNVDDILSESTGANGFAILSAKLDLNKTGINVNESKIDMVKSKTDLIINNPATTTDITNIDAKLDTKPSITDIQQRLDLQSDYIKGPDNRNLTDVYDNERGTDGALLSTDPRLAFLDAAISTRSSHSVLDIWNAGTRTLTTTVSIGPAEIQAIWDHLTTSLTTPGSIGKLLVDNIDATLSSRSTLSLSDLTTALGPYALESTVNTVLATVINENNENEIKIDALRGVVDLIKPQTDLIPTDPAIHTAIINEINDNEALLIGIDLLTNAIKMKTDYIPDGDIARQSSLLNIPTDPLLTGDTRLNDLSLLSNLDVPVSTRAESFPTDYAKELSLFTVRDNIIDEVNINESKINNLPSTSFITSQLIRLDDILLDTDKIMGAGFATAIHSLVKIKEAVDNISVGTGGDSAADIWGFPTRTLTNLPPDIATSTDIDNATTEIVNELTEYRAHMTTTFITSSDSQEVLCWLDKNGQTLITTENARVTVSDGLTDIWSGQSDFPDGRGVFRISQANISALISQADRNYTMTIRVEYTGMDFVTVQPFYTVG